MLDKSVQRIGDAKLRQRELKRLHIAAEAHRSGIASCWSVRKSGWRIRPRPPFIPRFLAPQDDTLELVAHTAFEAYKVNQPEERGVLLDRYRLADAAFKVVGIGGVATFCALGLFTNRDGATMLLQLKEAQQSVLAPYAAPSVYLNQGQRVVTGQRIMQGEHDKFLGWTQEHVARRACCYVRELEGLTARSDRRTDRGQRAPLLRHAVRHDAGPRMLAPATLQGLPAIWDLLARSIWQLPTLPWPIPVRWKATGGLRRGNQIRGHQARSE